MVDRHVCQLTNEHKAKVLSELYHTVKRFQALEPKKEPLYKDEDVPLFLKRRIPKFKFNHELRPLISSCSTIEVRFTTNPRCKENQNEDPNVVFALIQTPGNPFKNDDLGDELCNNMCDNVKACDGDSQKAQNQKRPANLPCPIHDVVSGLGVPYQCTHDVNCPGIVVCKDLQSGQSFLCTVHVQRPPANRLGENHKLVKEGVKGAGLSSLLPPPDLRITTPVFVLAIDGGGIRSLLSLYALNYLEKRLQMPISSVFDVMAATSTASIVAAGLAIPDEAKPRQPMYSTEELLRVLEMSMPEIFVPDKEVDPYVTRPRYTDQNLDDFLEVFYPGLFGSSLTKLVLPTYNRNSEDIYTFGSWEDAHRDLEYSEVLRATAASPNYFTEVEMVIEDDDLRLVEGGLLEYNPTGLAADIAMKLFTWQPQVVLSLGSGINEKKNFPYVARTPASPVWGSPFQDIKIRCEAESHHQNMADKFGKKNYFRTQMELNLDEETLLHDFHKSTEFIPSTLAVFENVGKRYVQQNKEVLKKFIAAFKDLDRKDNTWIDSHDWSPIVADQDLMKMTFNSKSPMEFVDTSDRAELEKVQSGLTKCQRRRMKSKPLANMMGGQHYYYVKENPFYGKMKKFLERTSKATDEDVYKKWVERHGK